MWLFAWNVGFFNALFSDGYIIKFLDVKCAFLMNSILLEVHAETFSYEMIDVSDWLQTIWAGK